MIAYFDCFSGASGDMILGSLIDAGADLSLIEAELSRLGIPFELSVAEVQRCGIRATKVDITAPEGTSSVMRTYSDALRLVEGSGLPPDLAQRAASIFGRLARAEAKVHGLPVGEVHFHELDGVDTIVDVVGGVTAFALLGANEVMSSPVASGTGVVPSRHGPLPLPAPAVLEILGGGSIYGREIEAELITPTGAAILAEFATSFGKMPAMTVAMTGYGAGSRELDIPNVLRLIVGEPVTAVGAGFDEGVEDLLIEATIDDMNPELYPYVLGKLTEAGAIDAWLTPVIGKHGRPAQVLSMLAPPGLIELIRETLVNETSTLGVRATTVRRWMLRRTFIEVDVLGRAVRVKVGLREGIAVNVAPEYADCAAVAEATGEPIKEIYRLALAAASARALLGPFPPIP